MDHPKDRSRISRRQFVRLAAGSAVGVGAAGALAGCENTTAPIGANSGGLSGEAAELVVGKPTGPGGLPLPRPDNAVTWAITATNKPIADGRPTERGPLSVYNYADYIDPALIKRFEKQYSTSVGIATYNSADEAIAKLASGAVGFDVIIGLTGSNIVDLIAQRLLQPLNHSYLPNLANIWPGLQDPFYDRGSRYTVPYTVWSDGIGWRNDKVKEDIAGMDVPWDIFWHSQAYRGFVGILDDKRDALSMPMQRDAMRTGARPDLNTESAAVINHAESELAQLDKICNPKVTITDYQTLPEGKTVLHQSWSGDLLSAAFYYMPKGVKPDVLSYWAPQQNGVVQNDFLCIGRSAKSPVLAHNFINFVLDEKNAYSNFVDFTGYTPPQNAIDAEALIKRGLIPKSLAQAVVRPDQFAANQELLQLSVEGERFWDNAWSKFKAG
ncbi:MAG TPA: spermidine/putrescine ABC transporter substrate-binding protein [Gaiellaceae bacterium]|jgi:spermidine/putrescine transport system substrate-binding protein|nr:spermidine/putrescine ABC transporter substrate-binding protein [Gaiellaceae bacterium]